MDPLEGTLCGRLSTDLTSELTHFNPGIRLRKGKPSALFRDSDADQAYQIPGFETSNSWLEDYQWAVQDPSRVKTASELPQSHKWDIVDALPKHDWKDLKHFKGAMYEALAKVHTTSNGSKLRIKVPKDSVDNISNCFARARMLNPDLARRTESFFVEWPNQLLTVAVPTDFDIKDAWGKQADATSSSFLSTTSGRRFSLQSWCSNSRPETWTWTVWPLFDPDSKAFNSSRRRRPSTWPKRLPNSCNRGFLLQPPLIRPVSNASWISKHNSRP